MTRQFFRAGIAMLTLGLLAACSLPRGAAIQSEITGAAHNNDDYYSVIEVDRATMPVISRWPVTGGAYNYNWLSATRGPKSNLIRSGDTVNLVIWDSQENSLLTSGGEKVVDMRGLEVSTSGSIFLPYADEVVIAGQTPDQARRTIQDQLGTILPDAQVQLAVTAGESNSVDLVAGVAKPGAYPLPSRDFRILSLVSLGGGIAPGLRNPLITLSRDGRVYKIPARKLYQTPELNVVMRGGDQVVVQEDERFFTALGATGQEDLVYFDRDEVTALEAMSMVGGVNDARGNPKGVLVLREYPATAVRPDRSGPDKPYVVFVIDLTSADGLFSARNFHIYPGDTVMVTESPAAAARTLFGLIGSVFVVSNQVGNI